MKSALITTHESANQRHEVQGQGRSAENARAGMLIAGPILALLVSTSLLMFLVLLFAHGLSTAHHALLNNVGFSQELTTKASHLMSI